MVTFFKPKPAPDRTAYDVFKVKDSIVSFEPNKEAEAAREYINADFAVQSKKSDRHSAQEKVGELEQEIKEYEGGRKVTLQELLMQAPLKGEGYALREFNRFAQNVTAMTHVLSEEQARIAVTGYVNNFLLAKKVIQEAGLPFYSDEKVTELLHGGSISRYDVAEQMKDKWLDQSELKRLLDLYTLETTMGKKRELQATQEKLKTLEEQLRDAPETKPLALDLLNRDGYSLRMTVHPTYSITYEGSIETFRHHAMETLGEVAVELGRNRPSAILQTKLSKGNIQLQPNFPAPQTTLSANVHDLAYAARFSRVGWLEKRDFEKHLAHVAAVYGAVGRAMQQKSLG